MTSVPQWLASVPQHVGKEHIPVLFHGTQCPDRASTLYLLVKSLAWVVVVFSTSQEKDPQVVKIGWHLVKPRYSVFRYLREEREQAWVLNKASQYCSCCLIVNGQQARPECCQDLLFIITGQTVHQGIPHTPGKSKKVKIRKTSWG